MFLSLNKEEFELPKGETVKQDQGISPVDSLPNRQNTEEIDQEEYKDPGEIMITDGVKHSIPLDEILSGGPGKDGIPSIDDPVFISTQETDEWLDGESIGLGLEINGDARFYPFPILVWHEIVNDNFGDKAVAVTYCPLCGTGIVFDRNINGVVEEFGVSGKLWQSNLLMYNRSEDPSEESLWTQVLGQAVLGTHTGTRLDIVSSDVVSYDAWKQIHPETKVLSKETGANRNYGRDPYGEYYTSGRVSFGADFKDERLHPKAFVIGISIDDSFKAYHIEALPVGTTEDLFANKKIEITKTDLGQIDVKIQEGSDFVELPYVSGFWFSWAAVHPDTELYK